MVGVVGLVGHELANGSCGVNENGSHYHIVCIAGAEEKNSGPSASVSAWILVVRPPRERPIASA
jgi:hypothetical protein